MNLFSSTENQNMLNIATGVLIDGKEKDMLLECISDGDKAYNDFAKSWLESHQKQLFDVISKTMNKTILSTKKKNVDIHLDTTKALRYIDFARARG